MSIPEEKELSFIERLRDLSWTDFSYVIGGLELASASQRSEEHTSELQSQR